MQTIQCSNSCGLIFVHVNHPDVIEQIKAVIIRGKFPACVKIGTNRTDEAVYHTVIVQEECFKVQSVRLTSGKLSDVVLRLLKTLNA